MRERDGKRQWNKTCDAYVSGARPRFVCIAEIRGTVSPTRAEPTSSSQVQFRVERYGSPRTIHTVHAASCHLR